MKQSRESSGRGRSSRRGGSRRRGESGRGRGDKSRPSTIARMRAGTSDPEYAESIGDSLDLAIRQAVDILGAREDEVDVEVLEEGRRGFLWFTPKRPYRVRVTWQADETHEEIVGSEPSEKTRESAEGHAPRRAVSDDRSRSRRPRSERRETRAEEAPRGRFEEEGHAEAGREVRRGTRREPSHRTDREVGGAPDRETRQAPDRELRQVGDRETRPAGRQDSFDRRRESRPEIRPEARPSTQPRERGDEEQVGSASEAEKFVSGVLSRMQLDAQLAAHDQEDGIRLRVSGSDAEAFLAERDGEVQSALQVLTHRVLSRRAERSVPVVIEVGETGPAHDSDLHATAMRLAEEVTATSQPAETAPLSSSDRRIIHRTLADHPSVVTESQGRGLLKRVRISPR